MESKVRIAFPEESDALARVMVDAFKPFENLYTPKAFAATILDTERIHQRFGEPGAIWMAEIGTEVVGTVSVLDENKSLYVRSMAVSPNAQGNGIGYQLLDVAETYAVENGFRYLSLYTTPFLDAAIRLYENNGFIRGQDDGFFGTPLLAMTKVLN